MQTKRSIYWLTFLLGISTLISYILGTNMGYSFFSVIQAISGTVFILFIPGYFCTLSFFRNTEIDVFERIALSIAISISTIPLLSFYGNLIGIPIHFYSIMAIVVSIVFLNIGYDTFFQKTRNYE